jgi:hypothetical protein
LVIFAVLICSALSGKVAAAKTVRLSGTVFTLGADQTQTLWPSARVTLKNLTSGREVSTVSDDLGQYSFAGILPGDYELSVALAGFETLTRRIALSPDDPAPKADLQLTPQKHSDDGNGQREFRGRRPDVKFGRQHRTHLTDAQIACPAQ